LSVSQPIWLELPQVTVRRCRSTYLHAMYIYIMLSAHDTFLESHIRHTVVSFITSSFFDHSLIMLSIFLLSLVISLFFVETEASSRAIPAAQHITPRAEYQGGWPLALTGTASGSCPADATVLCSKSQLFNPSCCPTGQTFVFGSNNDAYCCPTSN
jgi:hypothetical protein